MTEEKKAMKDKKIAIKAKETQIKTKKIQNKAKETQKKTKKIQNKAQGTEKKANKAKVIKGVAKKVVNVERDKEIKKKAKEAEKKAQEAKKRAQEEVRKMAQEEEIKYREAEKRIREAEKKAREVEVTRVHEAEKSSREAEIKVIQEEKKKVKDVEIKTKEEMKIMEEEKKPMEDKKKAKEVKVKTKVEEKKPMEEQKKPMEEQKTTMESPADFSPPTNNNGRTAVFISLIAMAVAFFNFFTPPASAPTQNVDLSGIEDNINAVSSSVKKMNSKITENRKLLDSQIASSSEKFEQQKAETDKMYLTSGLSEMVKGMQPSLEIYCKRAVVSYIKLSKTAKTGTNTVAVDCNFDNKGTLKANIVPGSIILIGGKGQEVIDNAVERIDNGEETTILPGKSSEKQYHIVLTDAGALNMKGGVMKMNFQAYTDKAALARIKRKTSKNITGEQLKKLTETNHMFSFLL